jgi:predicted AAA+ superfamily ATPase
VEVDFVIQSRQRLLPMEIKMTSRARVEDIRSLESFLDEYPKQAPIGLLFYGGEETISLTPRILAIPVRTIL